MNTERLRVLRRYLGELLALPPGDRVAGAKAVTAEAPELLPDLLDLLRTAEGEDLALEPPATGDDDVALAEVAVEGRRLGAFRLLRSLERGGMGDVWLAERADGSFTQQVAIKFPRGDWRRPSAFERFEQERRMLARVDHPGIARIVDGGQTDSGRPWLAMDYVDGAAIDRHAKTRGLDVRARIGLVVQVCEALAAAHRALIVHRDLKPTNVLVGADGRPRLVDFGIAGLLDSSGDVAPLGGLYFATPRYASPEQLHGGPTSTASDVYSLACIARGLVAEAGETADADLDAILVAATHGDPARRTGSAEALAAELDRWLGHRPVAARPPGLARRFALFCRRNPTGALLSVALVVTLLAAFAVVLTLWRAERAERLRVEQAENALAERFSQVREVVRSLVFGVHDRIGTLPGAVPVRHFVVETALQHLDRLSQGAGDDPDLIAEIAEVHLRLAAVRGLRGQGSLGDPAGAAESASAARDLVAPRAATDPRFAWLATRAFQSLGDAARDLGDLSTASVAYREMAETAQVGLKMAPEDRRLANALAISSLQSGKLSARRGDTAAALLAIEQACETWRSLDAAVPGHRETARNLGLAYSERAFALVLTGAAQQAIADWQRARECFETRLAAAPDDLQLRRDRIEVLTQIALTRSELGESEAAIAQIDAALVEARAMAAEDAGNAMALHTLTRCLVFAARIHNYAREFAGAVALYEEVESRLRAVSTTSARDQPSRQDLLESLVMRGEILCLQGEPERAEAAFAAGLEIAEPEQALQRRDHLIGHLLTIAWLGLGQVALERGDFTAAVQRFSSSRGPIETWARDHAALQWPLRQLLAHCAGCASAREALAKGPALTRGERIELLGAARADHARGQEIAERLRDEQRLAGHEAELPQRLAADVARLDAMLAELRAGG